MLHRRLTVGCLPLFFLLASGLAQTAAPPEAVAAPAPTPRVEVGNFKSEALGREVKLQVHLPAAYSAERRFPVIYFLHGLRGSEKTWEQRGAHRILDGLVAAGKVPPVIVACPDGGNSFYINAKGRADARYADMVVKDLVAHVDGTYRTTAAPGSRGLLGDSMGGYGALLLAFRHPDVFQAVAAHEGSIFPEDRSQLPPWVQQGRGGRPGLLTALFGDPIDEQYWLDHNLFHIVRTAPEGRFKGLKVYFDVGKDDRYGLAAPTKAWHDLLDEKGVSHQFTLRDGGHGREFFLDNLPESLQFLGETLSRPAGTGESATPKHDAP